MTWGRPLQFMIKGKKIIAIVPARGGSKGVPLKNIQPIRGVPLVAIVGNLVEKISIIDCSVLSTDHPEIKKIGEESGLEAPFFRPDEISGDNIGDIPVLIHSLEEMEKRNECVYDIVVMLPPTSPLRRSEHVIATIEKLVNQGYDAVWTVSESDTKYHPYKQLKAVNGKLHYYDADQGEKIVLRQQLDKLYYRNGVAYAMTRQYLIDHGNDQNLQLLEKKRIGFELIEELMVNIDSKWEFQFAEFILDNAN